MAITILIGTYRDTIVGVFCNMFRCYVIISFFFDDIIPLDIERFNKLLIERSYIFP